MPYSLSQTVGGNYKLTYGLFPFSLTNRGSSKTPQLPKIDWPCIWGPISHSHPCSPSRPSGKCQLVGPVLACPGNLLLGNVQESILSLASHELSVLVS